MGKLKFQKHQNLNKLVVRGKTCGRAHTLGANHPVYYILIYT